MQLADIKKNILKTVFEGSPVLFAYIFGSMAIDQAHSFSDLDIAVCVPQLSLRDKMDLAMSLSLKIDDRLKDGPPSDVRIINDLPLSIAGQIVTRGILVYCRDDLARIDFETSTRKAYFDFLPVIHQYRQSFLDQMGM